MLNLKKTILLMLVIFSFSTNLFCQKNKAAKLIFFKGKVQYSVDNGRNWQDVKLKQTLEEGTCIKTNSTSEAALLLSDHSQIRIKSNSIFCLKKSGSPPGILPGKIGLNKLLKGKIWFRNKRKGTKPIFETPVVTASIRGTEMVIEVDNSGNKSNVTVLEGKVNCFNEKGRQIIKRVEVAQTTKGMAPKVTVLAKPELSAQWLIITPDIVGPKERELQDKSIRLAKDAVRELSLGNLQKAKQLINEAYNLGKERAAVNVAMATILQAQGKFEEALKFAAEGYNIDPLSVPAMLRKVEILSGLDKISKAYDVVSSFKGTDDARIHIVKGYLYLVKKEIENAEREFKTAISLNPSVATSHLGLGIALYSLGNIEKGLEEMEKASLLEPFAAYPHNYLAKALYEQGERHEAEIELKRAIQLDPNDPTPHLYLSIILTDQYRRGESVKELQKAIELNNNLLATRSRFLLDQDRSIKNVSLSYSLAEVGLNEWAKATGDKAVWDDPTNSGAYLFRASEAVSQKNIDPSTLGDVKRAQLLQPVNSNTYITYTGYQSLLEVPEIKGSAWGIIGNDKSDNIGAFVNGGSKKIAFYIDGIFNTTNGPEHDSYERLRQSLTKIKTNIAPNHQIMLSAVFGHRDEGDLTSWRFENINPEHIDTELDYWSFDLGYHWRQGAGKSLLINFQGVGKDSSSKWKEPSIHKLLTSLDSKLHQNTWRIELLELFRLNNHRFSFGAALENRLQHFQNTYFYPAFYGIKPNKISQRIHRQENRVFIRDIWKINDFIFTGGIGYCYLDNLWLSYNKYTEKDKILPEIGIAYNISRKDNLRLAYFEEIQPDYLSGSLLPMKIAGFKKVVGSAPGTLTRFYGAGWDRTWSNKFFTRIELYRTLKRYPVSFSPYPSYFKNAFGKWRNEEANTLKFVLNALLNNYFALSFTVKGIDFKAKKPIRDRDDYNSEFKLTYTHPIGIKSQFVLWLVSQDEDGNEFGQNLGDDFVIASFYIEKSLFDKKGLIFFTAENIFNEKYRYLIYNDTQATQLPYQGFLAKIGVKWNF